MTNYGLGYMGSKSGIAEWIVNHLPKATHLYDLFAGGCAVTHRAMLTHRFRYLHANDITETPVLFRDAIRGRYHDERRWISREEFMAKKSTDMYIRACWSFGNNGEDYLYSAEIEPYKRACHYAVVLDEWDELRRLCPEVWQAAHDAVHPIRDIHRRRIRFGPAIVKRLKDLRDYSIVEGNPLYRSCHKRITQGTSPDATYLQSLESLERLQSLERLESLRESRLTVSVGDYQAVEIEPDSVIYCDPPYANTASYNKSNGLDGFDHERFYDWCRRQTVPVLISEYNMPPDFICIDEIGKNVTLSQNTNTKAVERLFVPAHQADLFKTTKQLSLF